MLASPFYFSLLTFPSLFIFSSEQFDLSKLLFVLLVLATLSSGLLSDFIVEQLARLAGFPFVWLAAASGLLLAIPYLFSPKLLRID